MSNMMKLPIGIQNFEKLRNEGYVYIDKTPLIWRMVNEGKYYFLSRPRRFGKSLLMSTIQAFFEGKKQYFDGTVGYPLFIATDESVDWKWEVHPIFYFDFNAEYYRDKETLESRIEYYLSKWESTYHIESEIQSYTSRFEQIIEAACKQTGRRVVILVDGYDRPEQQATGNKELQEDYHSILTSLFSVLDSKDKCIRFSLLTGNARLNNLATISNLKDISVDYRYNDICGFKSSDLDIHLKPVIEEFAKQRGLSYKACMDRIHQQYDGYHFDVNTEGIYNPHCILTTLKAANFNTSWYVVCNPTYVTEQLVCQEYSLEDLAQACADTKELCYVDREKTEVIPLLYQSGYLTINGYDEELKKYTLGFPNKDVEEGFIRFLIPNYLSSDKASKPFPISQYVQDLEQGYVEHFVQLLYKFLDNRAFESSREMLKLYHNQVWLLHKLLGMYVLAEYHTSVGRIDMVLQTPKFCYVIEFKFDGSAQDALDQISRKDYALPFALSGQQVIRIGMNISRETRNVEDYKIG